MIEVALPVCRLRDLRSKYCALVHARVLTASEPREGDILEIGRTILLMKIEGDYEPEVFGEPERYTRAAIAASGIGEGRL